VVPNVQEEFHAELWEDFTPQGRQIALRLSTIEKVECKNATIDYDFERQGDNEQLLSINSIELPADCEEGEAPARSQVTLGPLENGVYLLSVSLRDAVSVGGEISVANNLMRLSIEEGAGITPLRSMTYRIPSNTIWGFFDIKGDAGLVDLANAFLEELGNLAEAQSLPEGHYGYFSIDALGNIKWEEVTEAENEYRYAFQYQYSNSMTAEIQSLLENYRADYGDSIGITLLTTDGESW
jgi:hypothetical protein